MVKASNWPAKLKYSVFCLTEGILTADIIMTITRILFKDALRKLLFHVHILFMNKFKHLLH